MTLSVRTRFEVFKRDRFTCSYCGRTPPEVLLEVDHIVPRAAGGTDDLANLTTACATCNSGKAARLLEEGTAPVVGRATVEQLAERVEQAKAYMELLGGMQAVTDRQYGMVIDAWAKAFGATAEEREDRTVWVLPTESGESWPNEHSVRRFLRYLTLEDLLEAVSITASRKGTRMRYGVTNYFYGVCNRAIREGRSVGYLATRTPEPEAEPDRGYDDGYIDGQRDATAKIGDFLRGHANHGYESVWDAIAALWPEDG